MRSMMRLFNEMDKLLNSNFDPSTKIDACKMLVLMYKTSRNTELALLPFLPPYLLTVALLFMINTPLLGILAVASGLALIYFLELKRKEALDRLSNLVNSNPEYWQPIREKLREAISQK